MARSIDVRRRMVLIAAALAAGLGLSGCAFFEKTDLELAGLRKPEGHGRPDVGEGGGGGGGGSGSSSSDIRVKHDIVRLGTLANGVGFYRFAYNGEDKPYVGVMAQEIELIAPEAVTRGADGYMRVYYDRLGIQMQTYEAWQAGGGRLPEIVMRSH